MYTFFCNMLFQIEPFVRAIFLYKYALNKIRRQHVYVPLLNNNVTKQFEIHVC